MLASIRKFSKSFLAKIFIAIIALPFIMWGMGDVFRSGKQNVLVEINSEKINAQEFVNYIQKINLKKNEIESIGKSRIFDQILTNYISEKIIDLETKKKGIKLTDRSLKDILVNDKEFEKDGKFSRTKYEKFLLKNNFAAPSFERRIENMELKGQLLTYYSGGIKLPNFIINNLYKKEKQIKELEYINLNDIYDKKIISKDEIKDYYEKSKDLFKEKFFKFNYVKLTPKILTEKNDFDEDFFKRLDSIENEILDGKTFEVITKDFKKNVVNTNFINSRNKNLDGKLEENIDKKLINKIFLIKNQNIPELLNFDDNYYIVEVLEEKTNFISLNDSDLLKTIKKQIAITFAIKENKKILDLINDNKFNKNKMAEFSNKNKAKISLITINGLRDEKKFNSILRKEIYNYRKGQIFLLSDNSFQKNYLIRVADEKNIKINTNDKEYDEYIKKASSEYIARVYKSYDKYINNKYKIEINDKVVERLKNSFQ